MIYYHKNPTIKTLVNVIKIQYRDSKRIKFKGQLITSTGLVWKVENYEVGPDFFENFTSSEPKIVPDHEDLTNLDLEKENYIL